MIYHQNVPTFSILNIIFVSSRSTILTHKSKIPIHEIAFTYKYFSNLIDKSRKTLFFGTLSLKIRLKGIK